MSSGTRKAGAVGRPVSRVDGPLKVTGRATFTAEYKLENLAYGAIVTSTVARGTIEKIDAEEAEAAPGVLAVVTHENAPKMRETAILGDPTEPGVSASTIVHFQTDEVFYYGQPIAVVVAETVEQAYYAATLVTVDYTLKEPRISFDAERPNAVEPQLLLTEKPELEIGDAEATLAAARHSIDHVYTTPPFNHNAIELHATTAEWSDDGERLTVYEASQYVVGAQNMFAKKFGLDRENVRVVASYVGGGFGGKGTDWGHVSAAAAAAKVVGRPVSIMLTREQVHLAVGGRSRTEQRVALGADESGRLTSLVHTGISQTTEHNEFAEPFTFPTRHLYASETMWLRQEVVHLDVVPNTFMRAPGEAPGTYAIECAIDELAHEMGLDPIELRTRNEPDRDPAKGLPFSMRNLGEAYRVGAERFGWSRRNAAPGTTRDGRHLVGMGVATATYPVYQMPAAARVELRADGTAVGLSSAHEMGMGTATAQAQNLADRLGLPFERVRFEYGDSTQPAGPMAGGSNSTISVAAAVTAATDALKKKLHGLVGEDEASPLVGTRFDEVEFGDGRIHRKDDPTRGEPFEAILKRFEMESIEADGKAAPGMESMKYSMHSYGAQFSEVRVDEETGEVRVSRFLGVFDCGTIVNPKTASSQFRGGIVMGIGMALTEEALFDDRLGRIVNPSLAEYHVPVNLDVPHVDVHFLDIPDPHTPLGAHGIGEIGITGVAASIANAVFNATGRRIRDLPITLDKLL